MLKNKRDFTGKVVIKMASMYKLNREDLKNYTLETESDPYDVTDLLEVSDKITEKRAKELLEHIREVREDWDHGTSRSRVL